MKRKGFTLVELLIVIVVIGILSAMMMLSSTEAVTSAKASNIVSNLRNLKTAALSMYTDNLDKAEAGTLFTTDQVISDGSETETNNAMVKVIKYMNNADKKEYVNYGIVPIAGKGWFVYCKGITDARVQEKLAGRANSVGLSGADKADNLLLTTDSGGVFEKGDTVAGMWVVQPATLVTASN